MESPGEPEAAPAEYVHFSTSATVDRATIIARGPQKTLEDMALMAEALRERQTQTLFEAVERVSNKVGNVVDAGGQPFTFETFMELLGRIQLDFDAAGWPLFPSIAAGPEMLLHIQQQMTAWEKNDEYALRFADLIDQKRREWNDRESNRKLVE